jgi:hypothetical protein
MSSLAAVLLDAWEHAAVEPVVDRAPALLRPLGRLADGVAADELSVGECDLLLFGLRRELFGEELEATTACPVCRADVEFSLRLADVEPAPGHAPPERATLEAAGYRVECRIPRNADLRALAALAPPTGPSELLERCLVAASDPDGNTVTAGRLPEAVSESVAVALAARDPGASVPLTVHCECGAQWDEELDIRSVLWSEVSDWAASTLAEVQQLALAYGWSEHDILELSPWRRRWYLEAAW